VKDKIMMLVFVLVCGTILTSALVFVNQFTAPIIEKNEALKLKRNVLSVLGIPHGDEAAEIESAFEQNVKVSSVEGRDFYRNEAGDTAFEFAGAGLWGPITGVIALSTDLAEVRDLTIMRQEETPGLGSRIGERAHLDKFIGRTILPALASVGSGKGKNPTDVDAITGATLSSNAFIELLNRNIAELVPIAKGAGL
jgi:Na+-transporting NADH:ubiquinone oxidoreductase subunit C